MCTDLLCVVCIGVLSDEFPTGRPMFWKDRDLNQVLQTNNSLAINFLK